MRKYFSAKDFEIGRLYKLCYASDRGLVWEYFYPTSKKHGVSGTYVPVKDLGKPGTPGIHALFSRPKERATWLIKVIKVNPVLQIAYEKYLQEGV